MKSGFRSLIRWAFSFGLLLGLHGWSAPPFPAVHNTEPSTEPLLAPDQTVGLMKMPEGFRATLFAAEPDVRQPIALTFDGRGRLWVAENYTYSERAVGYDWNLRDRILVFEDTDHDGVADRRKVFWDEAQNLTSIEEGFGGIWALCPPRLLFIPDRDGDDVPDGPAVTVLDGWEANRIRHNFVNGLRWGPDGWLYGRHGITTNSRVGVPGSPDSERIELNCSIWRYHPKTKKFEVVTHGTTNAWGHDWDENGQLFFINTVIGHLWHAVPGAHFERMFGDDFNPYLYRLIPQTADHYHWDTKEAWSDLKREGLSGTSDAAGGGHAHCGMMIYQGDNWPRPYRGGLFALNLHGRRINHDRLDRDGAGYTGRHEKDFSHFGDAWFRGIDLAYGPDGGVFVLDWSDLGECHENDGVHRTSGRIFKITHGQPNPPPIRRDLHALSNAELVKLLFHENEWYSRRARLVLQERAGEGKVTGGTHRELVRAFEKQSGARNKLRALWALNAIGTLDQEWLLRALEHEEEHVRVWAVRLLVDDGAPSPEVVRALTSRAGRERSGLVQLYLASALQRIPLTDRWELARHLVQTTTYAEDRMLPLMVWYGLEPAAAAEPGRSIDFMKACAFPEVRKNLARRVTGLIESESSAVSGLMALALREGSSPIARNILEGMATALRGWRKAPKPDGWEALVESKKGEPDPRVRQWIGELSVVFGSGKGSAELIRLAGDRKLDLETRRQAVRALGQVRDPGLFALVKSLLRDRAMEPDALRALAAANDPGLVELIRDNYGRLYPPGRTEAVNQMTSRPETSRQLLDWVRAGRVRPEEVSPLHQSRMLGYGDAKLRAAILELWPGQARLSADKQKRLEDYLAHYTTARLNRADRAKGKALFTLACAACHKLFGEGGAIGPELTGSDRANLTYLLENLVDPSATLPDDYRVSVVRLKDGRVINGIVKRRDARTLTLQDMTAAVDLDRNDILSEETSAMSLMPEGLLEALAEEQRADLLAYLMRGPAASSP